MSITCNNCGTKNNDFKKFCEVCNNSLGRYTSRSPLTPGTILEKRYEIMNLIKSGGMGTVYKAQDNESNCLCAVKELLPYYGSYEEEMKAVNFFKREAEILDNLSHPNLPEVIDYFISGGRYYLAMNFIEGEDLESQLLKEGTPGLGENKIIVWTKQLLQVMDYLHNQNPPIVYRDIKPGNIMLHKNERVILVDFGIARAYENDSTKTVGIGTMSYCPMEQFQGKPDMRSDIYALGATMYHLLTGIQPIPFNVIPLKETGIQVSGELEAIVMKSLEDEPEKRFGSAKEMLKAVINMGKKRRTSSFEETEETKILSGGVEINSVNNYGWSLLHKAVCQGKEHIIKLLISKGADVNIKDDNGYSPLDYAKIKNNPAVIKLLSDYL
jgi:serine/threonine-protein kinase